MDEDKQLLPSTVSVSVSFRCGGGGALSGDLGFDLLGLMLTGGERLIEWDRSGEAEEEEEEKELELDSLLRPTKFSAAMAEKALLEPDPVPFELSRPFTEPLGE